MVLKMHGRHGLLLNGFDSQNPREGAYFCTSRILTSASA